MVHRIDIRTRGQDPAAHAVRQQIAEFLPNLGDVTTSRIFLIDTDAAGPQLRQVADELLADPIVEAADVMTAAPADGERSRIEIHLKPGVMDPVATSTEMAIRDIGLGVREIRTGRSFVLNMKVPPEQLKSIASRVLANGVIESVHLSAFIPQAFERGREYHLKLQSVSLIKLDDEQLKKLSREGHLFLSLAEMKAVQKYFQEQGREPTDIELETIAQTWSEHCVHNTLKSRVDVCDETGKVLRSYKNLIKETIFDSTMTLMKQKPGFCLSVFKDNAGVIAFDEQDAVCFKVETHNHPSAIEPYGGAATGAGGCIRDVLGTGLAAKPVANTDIFCVAYPDAGSSIRNPKSEIRNLPKGVIHPKRILQQVVAGVRDYGNRMGIPTINGAVYFDDRYLGNPLVFCGCVGLLPNDKIFKATQPGDAIVVMGGRTGRDGIHGATFSSAELTDTHADEFSHAVQIGNAITQKKMADVILQARDRGLFTAVTDCGAGGLSSAVGEMAEKLGADVQLEKVPLKYDGLRYDEIWISEAQERMVLSVPQDRVKELLELAKGEDVETTVIGSFGTPNRELILNYHGTQVGKISMHFMHDGIPMPMRKAIVDSRVSNVEKTKKHSDHRQSTIHNRLLALLAHPNIASKHWIIRQYDHEVQGGSVIKPLIGPRQVGPSDASVFRPKLSSKKAVVVSCGLCPQVEDPYEMALAAIDEAVRNAVCVGGDPDRMAILDNFCWPSVDDEMTMGTLVRACEGCRDGALAYGIPFISGKDSLHNQFTNQETKEVLRIPRTLLISAIGVIADARKCITMDFKHRGSRVAWVRAKNVRDLASLAKLHRVMHQTIATGNVLACHDVSDGGALVAAAEMAIASGLGLIVNNDLAESDKAWDEQPGQYLLEFADWNHAAELQAAMGGVADVIEFGLTSHLQKLTLTTTSQRVTDISIDELTKAWRGALDW